jgi:catechol 2,3-dioxygenase-like lactoylglutathione lyase family enzyme
MLRLMFGLKRPRRRAGGATGTDGAAAGDRVVDLIPFLFVTDVRRAIGFYEALGFRLGHTFAPGGRLEFAELESTRAAKLMLARVDRTATAEPERASAGFLYLYTHSLEALRKRLLDRGFKPGEIVDGSPGPSREMCVLDPDGHGHMVTELALSSVAQVPDGW